jgi:hypothetical protein
VVEQWPFKPKVVGSIPTAPTSFLFLFTGLVKSARQQKAALRKYRVGRRAKIPRHGWQADSYLSVRVVRKEIISAQRYSRSDQVSTKALFRSNHGIFARGNLGWRRKFSVRIVGAGSFYVAGEADRHQRESEVPPDSELPAVQTVQEMLDVFPLWESLHKILPAPLSEPKHPAQLVTSTVRTEKLRGKRSITLPFFLRVGCFCFLPTAALLFSCRLPATASQSP